jgi:hypothetical protein
VRRLISLALLIGAAGCSPIAPLPSFHPAEYTDDQIRSVPEGMMAFSCRTCAGGRAASEVCATMHPLEKRHYWGRRTSGGSTAVQVTVQMDYRNVGETPGFLPIRQARLIAGDDGIEPRSYDSDFSKLDYIPPGGSRSLTVGFDVAEALIRAVTTLAVSCPCPGNDEELLTFEFAASGGGGETSTAAPR